jgi:hypothetical protein
MSENKIQLSGIFSEGYGFVPKKMMRATDINNTTKVVLCYLLSFTGSGTTCFPQIKDMAKDLGLTTRTIINCIKSASDEKYIAKYQENRGGKIGKRNIYEMLFMNNFNLKEHVKNNSHAKMACETDYMACEKNDKEHVKPGQSNNNSINNNILNNNITQKQHTDLIWKAWEDKTGNKPVFTKYQFTQLKQWVLLATLEDTKKLCEIFNCDIKEWNVKRIIDSFPKPLLWCELINWIRTYKQNPKNEITDPYDISNPYKDAWKVK